MKRCNKIEKALRRTSERPAWQDLDEALQDHLQNCAACRQLFDSLGIVETVLAEQGRVPMPGDSYFDALPQKVLERLDKPRASVVAKFGRSPSRIERLLALRYLKPAFAVIVTGFIGIVIFQNLPEGARLTLVKNSQKVAADRQIVVEPEPEMAIQAKSNQPAEVENAAPAKSEEQTSKQEIELSGPAAKKGEAPIPMPHQPQDADLEKSEEAQSANLRTFESAEIALDMPAASSGLRSRINALPVAAKPEAERATILAESKGAVAFAVFYRRAQNAPTLESRAEIWQQFLAATGDSSQYALGLVELAKTTKSLADSTTEVLMLANAVSWFESNAATLRPLMGEQEFEKNFNELKARLQRARTGQLQ